MVLLITGILGCEENNVSQIDGNSSFGHIQNKIFDVSCAVAGCHSSVNDYSFPQHRLVLHSSESYENLVDAEPVNDNAIQDGLKRVVPHDPERSLLWHKLHCTSGHHASDYGNMMPWGGAPLSKGQMEFIRQWIESGAPKEGRIDADHSLLDDGFPGCEPEEPFTPMEAPPAGTGYQVKIDSFEVSPGFEREIFVYKEVGNATPFFVNRIKMKMRPNSHHFLVNTFTEDIPGDVLPEVDVIRDLRHSSGSLIQGTITQMEYLLPVFGSQTPELDYEFPPGVALLMPAHHKLDVNLHYVNKGNVSIAGECAINLYKADSSAVLHKAVSLFLNFDNIQLPPGERTVIMKTFVLKESMNIFMLTSHTHKYGEIFQIRIEGGARDGEIIYTSMNWSHPEIKTYDSPITILPGEGLTMIVTYNNTSDHAVRAGFTSEDEMAIIYGYYY